MAKRFVFRFETMLKIRRQNEERRQRVVAKRLQQIHEVRERMAAIDQQIHDEERAVMGVQRPGVIDLNQAMRHRHWLGHLHKSNLEAEGRLRYLEAELSQERAALAEAVKQRKILEMLKERQLKRYQQEEDRREANAADEMSTLRFVFDRKTELQTV